MQWFEEVAEFLEPDTIYTNAKLVALMKAHYPYVSQGSYHWSVNGMIKCGKLVRIGYDQYRLSDGTEREYVPAYAKSTQMLLNRITKKFPVASFTVFETSLISEFVEQGIGDNSIFIQVERAYIMDVFQYLKERYKMHLLLKPSKKDFLLYKRPDCVVLSNLFTESPIKCSRPHDIRIEKLLVDAFCDKLISTLFEKKN